MLVSDTKPTAPSVHDVANHLFAAFRPRLPDPSTWPPRDVTLGQLRTLFMIRREGPLSIGLVAESLGVGAAAASGFVERIERHGLVERRHRTDDRRIVECHLTEAGERLLDDLAGVQMNALRRALGVLTPDERLEFDRLLKVIAARVPEIDQDRSADDPRGSEHAPTGSQARASGPRDRERQT